MQNCYKIEETNNSTLTKVGAVKGTYEITGKGQTATIKLNFTEVPEAVSGLKAEYELKYKN